MARPRWIKLRTEIEQRSKKISIKPTLFCTFTQVPIGSHINLIWSELVVLRFGLVLGHGLEFRFVVRPEFRLRCWEI